MGRISMPQGKGSQMHNRRDYEKIGQDIPDNIDTSKTQDNIVLVDMDVKEAYQEIFGEAVEKYNAKQKRDDRKIDSYLDKIEHSKNGEKVFYEDVLQWGRKEDFEANPELKEKATEALKKYATDFQKRNPNLRVIGAYIHLDEASPHLHLDYVPIASGYKQGMSLRNSLDKALEQQGIEIVKDRKRTVKDKETGEEKEVELKEGRYNNRTMAWKEREREYFGEICQELGLELEEEQHLGRKQLTVAEYKEAERRMLEPIQKEADRQQEYIEALKEGGAYTNEQGEREFISYTDSIEHLETTQEHLSNNAFAYKEGGWFYDMEKQEGFTIPEGGIEQKIKEAESEAERITDEASGRADEIISQANDKLDTMLSQLEAYESDQKAQINEKVKIYEQDQKKAVEGKLEPLQSQLDNTSKAIERNNGILQDQINQYNSNLETIKGQSEAITSNTSNLEELEKQLDSKAQELEQKSRTISSLDKVGEKLRTQGAEVYQAELPDGFMKKKTVTVIEGYSPKELERIIQRASLNQSVQKTVEKANTDAQGIINNAKAQANQLLAQQQANINRANELIRGEAERKRKLDAYEKTVKEKNASLTAENSKLQSQNTQLREDNNNLSGINEYLRDEYDTLKDNIHQDEALLKDLNAEVERKSAFVDAELSPEQLEKMLNDSVVTNLVQDTMHQTCLQLEEKGLLESGAKAFMKLDRKPILERFKEQIPEFIDKVKEHIQKMAERVIHKGISR